MTAPPSVDSGSGTASLVSLLVRWEQEYAQGRDRPAAELCPDDPGRAADLAALIDRVKGVRPLVGGMTTPEAGTLLPAPSMPGVGDDLPAVGPPGYELLGVLGKGGMGVVYQARQVALNRAVALKMVLDGDHCGPEWRARFLAEAEAVAAVKHPGVVEVYECGTHQGSPFLAMEFCEGGSLAERLAGTPLPPAEAAAVVEQVARAVQAAHQRGIVHRDLKPANVLVGQAFQPDSADVRLESLTYKVTDFGLVKRVEGGPNLTATGAVMGTPSYMAPEQALGKKDVGPAADIYALGAILYECLTGRPPFRAATAFDTLTQVVGQEPVPPRRLNAQVPRDLQTICLKCLHKDPARRYESAAALADDLMRWRSGEPVRARPVGAVERAAKWARRRPAAAALVSVSMVGAAAVVAVTAVALAQWQRRGDERRHDVESALDRAARLRDSARWPEARRSLQHAEDRLAGTRSADLGQAVSQARADLELVAALDAIRLRKATLVQGKFHNVEAADEEYARVFAALLVPGQDTEEAASRVRASAVRGHLLAALDDWAAGATEPDRLAWLLEVARRVEPEPANNRFRDAARWSSVPALRELAEEAVRANAPAPLLGALAARLGRQNALQMSLRRAMVTRHPTDFWSHYRMANGLAATAPKEAVGYYRAALAIRPGNGPAYGNLGIALRNAGDLPGAIEAHQLAVRYHPGAPSYDHLGQTLAAAKDLLGAIAAFRKAIEYDPRSAKAHNHLGLALAAAKQIPQATAAFRQATKLAPDDADGHYNMGVALTNAKDARGAMAAYRTAVACDPKYVKAHMNLGVLLEDQGDRRGAINAYRRAIAANPRYARAYYRLTFALKRVGEPEAAEEAARAAYRLEPTNASYFRLYADVATSPVEIIGPPVRVFLTPPRRRTPQPKGPGDHHGHPGPMPPPMPPADDDRRPGPRETNGGRRITSESTGRHASARGIVIPRRTRRRRRSRCPSSRVPGPC